MLNFFLDITDNYSHGHTLVVVSSYLSLTCDASASCGGGKSAGDRREAAKEGAALFF